MNVLKLSLILLVISCNLSILGGCCKDKNNIKSKSSKSTSEGGSKPGPKHNPNPSHIPSHIPNGGHGTHGPGPFTPLITNVHPVTFTIPVPKPPVDYNSKTLDDIKLPPNYKQDKIDNYEYQIMEWYNISKEKAKEKGNNIRYYKTKDNHEYYAYIFFYDIFNDSFYDLIKLTDHIYYLHYIVSPDHANPNFISLKEGPEHFFW